jgi:hypothetical protein
VGSLSAFDAPQQHIDWGKKAVDEAVAIGKASFGAEAFALVVEDGAEPGDKLTKIKLVGNIPSELRRKYTEALKNFRDSFDQSIFAACQAIDRPIKDAHYPWADNPDPSLERRLEGSGKPRKTIPMELRDTIRAHQPYPTSPAYPGGDDLIRQLSVVANSKHTTGFRTGGRVSTISHRLVIRNLGGGSVFVPNPEWDAVKNEITVRRDILRPGTDIQPDRNYRFTFYVTFDADPPLGKTPAGDALDRFAAKAQEVLDTLKRRAIELGAS